MRRGFAVKVVMKAWNERALVAGMRSIQITLEPYMFSNNNGTVMFDVVGIREKRYAPQLQRTFHAGSYGAVLPGETEDGAITQEELDCRDAVDEILRYITPSIFSTLRTLAENSQLY